MSKNKKESLFWGVILLVIGTLFLVDNLGMDIDLWNIISDFWPMILILIGIKNIIPHIRRKE